VIGWMHERTPWSIADRIKTDNEILRDSLSSSFFFIKKNIFLVFLYYLNIFILKIIFFLKKYYFNLFSTKNTLKNNRNQTLEHTLLICKKNNY
jgi:hypothetical protein